MYMILAVPIILRALLDGGYLHGECLTVTGKTLAENLSNIKFPENQDIIFKTDRALSLGRFDSS